MWTGQFWMGGMWIFPLIFLLIMILFIFFIFGRGGFGPYWHHYDRDYRDHYINGQKESPLEILKKRYANGEISKDEFENMKRDIL